MEQELESSTLDFGRLVHFILTRSVLYGAHLDSGVLWLCLKLDLILECIELTAILFDDSSGVKLTSRVDSPPPRTGCWRFCCCPQPAFSTQDVLDRIGSDKEKIATVIWKLGRLLLINIKQHIIRHRMVKRNSSNHYIVHSWYIINPVLKILSVTGKGMNTSLQWLCYLHTS